MAVVPDDVINKVNAYGKGLLSKWSPQQTILSHPVSSFPRLRSYLVVLMASFRILSGHWMVCHTLWSKQRHGVDYIWHTHVCTIS